MKRLALMSLMMIGLLLVQTRIPGLLGIRPDLLLVFVILASLRFGDRLALETGALAGLMLDLYSGALIGPQILAKGVVGLLATRMVRITATQSLLLSLGIVTTLTLVHEALLYLVHEAFLPPGPANPSTAILQAALAAAVFLPLNALWNRVPIDEKPI